MGISLNKNICQERNTMESPVLRLKKQKGPNLYILKRTKTIQDEDIEIHWQWAELKKWYNKTESHPDCDWLDKALHTIMNSIVYQRRLAFALSRTDTRFLLSNDKNWNKPIGLKNENYKLLIAKLIEFNLIEEVQKGSGKELSIYKVVDFNLLAMLEMDTMDSQISEVIDFVDKYSQESEGTAEGDSKGDLEGQKGRKVEGQGVLPEPERIVENTSSSKITFQQLLTKQHSEEWPRFDDLQYLAQLAVTNCIDFEPDHYTMSVFKKYFKGMRGNLSKKQGNHLESLTDRFQHEAEKYLNLTVTEDYTCEEPDQVESKPFKQIVNDDKIQNHTLSMLKGTFMGDKIKILKIRLCRADSPVEATEIKHEIEYWENMNV